MKYFFYAFAVALISMSCKKSHDDGGCERSIATLTGSYSFIKFESKILGSYVDITPIALSDSCLRDDIITLYPDSTAKYFDLGLQCPTAQTNTVGTWSVHNGLMNIATGNINIVDANVDYFNCTKLMLTYHSTSPSADVRLTMTK